MLADQWTNSHWHQLLLAALTAGHAPWESPGHATRESPWHTAWESPWHTTRESLLAPLPLSLLIRTLRLFLASRRLTFSLLQELLLLALFPLPLVLLNLMRLKGGEAEGLI